MKIHLAQIPEDGLARTLALDLAAMSRLTAAVGAQTGTLTAELIVKNRDGNVEINGHWHADIAPPCQRCLEPVPLALDEPMHVALVPERAYEEAADDVHLDQGDLEVSFYAGEELDLLHILEDELLLQIPEPVAEEDEDGRCTVCGRRTDELFGEESSAAEDHPFARMKALLNPD